MKQLLTVINESKEVADLKKYLKNSSDYAFQIAWTIDMLEKNPNRTNVSWVDWIMDWCDNNDVDISDKESCEEHDKKLNCHFWTQLYDEVQAYLKDKDMKHWITAFSKNVAGDWKEHFYDEYIKPYFEKHPDQAPSFMILSYIRDVNNEWLIHYSNQAEKISKEGFKFGVDKLDNLAYSRDNKNGFTKGYNFAFAVKDKNDNGLAYYELAESTYGNEAVLFQASGVDCYHKNDEQNQVIFLGDTAYNLIYLRKNSEKGWYVCSGKDGHPLRYEKRSNKRLRIDQLVSWIIENKNYLYKQLNLR